MRPVALALLACAGLTAMEEPEKTKAIDRKAERKANRLAKEKSPYLLQHAHNPVDWYPWGAEAFEKAKREGKPIFLSIGYATCHWCHVMERESFENETIAQLLNERFVAIKVDREERPDVDAVYMAACQAQTGGGGWPLSAFLTPEGKPFFTGTYFPPNDDPRRGRGFLGILKQIDQLWKDDRQNLVEHAGRFAELLRRQTAPAGTAEKLEPRLLTLAYETFKDSFDDAKGGFGAPGRWAPKFPRTAVLDFLMRYAQTKEARADGSATMAIQMVQTTLDALVHGGIRDHLGGGFHRYSTDRRWLIPHFEKMLYDQALIARTFCDAWRLTRNEAYRQTARDALDYVLARLTSSEGGFFSAEDADTQGVEGLTYTWKRSEVIELLGKERGERFCEVYGVTAEGNFEEGGHGACVLNVALEGGVRAFAQKLSVPLETLERELGEDRAKLLAPRNKRPQPLLDDKVLVEWNGFAISAFAHVYQISGEPKYLLAARKAAEFILASLVKDGRLLRRFRAGEAAIDAFLEDHAALIEGLLDLYESSFEPRWLESATGLAAEMLKLFWDEKGGGFFSSGSRNEVLVAPTKEFYDGAVPSGNSVAWMALLRLEELTGGEAFRKAADEMSRLAAKLLSGSDEGAASHPYLLCGAAYSLLGAREIVIAGPAQDPLVVRMTEEAHRRFLPARAILRVESAEDAARLAKVAPIVEGKGPPGGKPAAFVCRRGVCKLPARDLEALVKALAE